MGLEWLIVKFRVLFSKFCVKMGIASFFIARGAFPAGKKELVDMIYFVEWKTLV